MKCTFQRVLSLIQADCRTGFNILVIEKRLQSASKVFETFHFSVPTRSTVTADIQYIRDMVLSFCVISVTIKGFTHSATTHDKKAAVLFG